MAPHRYRRPMALTFTLLALLSAHPVSAQTSSSGPAPPVAAPTAVDTRPRSLISQSAPPAADVELKRALTALAGARSYEASARGALGTALVVLTSDTAHQTLDALTEDLNIMCRIFDRALSQAGLRQYDTFHTFLMIEDSQEWIKRIFGDQISWTECLYVEGFGPLFLLSIDFPLVPPQQPATQPDPNAPRDPVWDQVARDLYTPAGRHSRPHTDQPIYNPEKPLALKTALVRALKHAVNIRTLADDTALTIMIRGREPSTNDVAGFLPNSDILFLEEGYPVPISGYGAAARSKTSLLVIRAPMADIRAFASGDLTFADFEQRLESAQY